MIQTIDNQPLTLPDAGAIASRLIALLPRRPRADIHQSAKAAGYSATALASPRVITAVILIAVYVILMVRSQVVLSRHARSAQTNAADAPVTPNHTATVAPLPSDK
jgi:hypothetical protein